MAIFTTQPFVSPRVELFLMGTRGLRYIQYEITVKSCSKCFFYLICVAQIDGRRMHVKGKLQTEDSRVSLTANVDGRVFKSWLVDLEGTLHIFTKVHVRIGIWIAALVIAVALVIQSYL